MVAPLLRINAVTRVNRDEMIGRVRAAIDASGAWVVDVKLFSNVSVCFNLEVPSRRLEQLREALAATGLHLTKECEDSFATVIEHRASATEGSPETDIAGTLQITFIHNEPDLRIEVPQIPG